MVHPQEMFTDDMHPAIGQQVMHVRDPSGQGVFNRDHGQVRLPAAQRLKSAFKRSAGKRFHIRVDFTGREVGIGAGLALKCNKAGFWQAGF